MKSIIWENEESLLLLNPAYSQQEKDRLSLILKTASNEWPNHIWVSTSGSSNPKWVGLSKQAILASAKAVNKHLQVNSKDQWVQALPDFHVGGIGVWARAYLSGSDVHVFKEQHAGKWNPEAFYRYLQQTKATLTTLVPTQLYDLIKLGWQAPPDLRAVVIGGGALITNLYEQATALNWPILPSYGLSECASQLATAELGSWCYKRYPDLHILDHLQVKQEDECLCFSGTSLFSTYAYIKEQTVTLHDPKKDGWFKSEDRGYILNRSLIIEGRTDSMIKIGGESVNLAYLEKHLQSLCLTYQLKIEVTLISMPDPRLGQSICLVSTNANEVQLRELIVYYQQSVLPFEQIRKVFLLPSIPKSTLGKILRKDLMLLIHEEKHSTIFVKN